MPRLYGRVRSNNAISANASHDTFHDKELTGYLELVSVFVAPDLDAADKSSNLDKVEIMVEERQILYDFKINYYANMLPWADIHPVRRPMNRFLPDRYNDTRLFGVKINKGKDFRLRCFAGSTAVDDIYYVRPFGYLYTDDEVKEIFGLERLDDFETLPGGIGQHEYEPWTKYGTNESATKPGEWYDIEALTEKIYAGQTLTLRALGNKPHDNQAQIQIADQLNQIKGTEYPFNTDKEFNELPFGCAWQDSGPWYFPDTLVPQVTFSDGWMKVQVKDIGTATIPANGSLTWCKGMKILRR